jgi:hypothetical protein
MSSKLKENIRIIQTFDRFMEDDFTITFELSLVASNINIYFLVCLILSFHF